MVEYVVEKGKLKLGGEVGRWDLLIRKRIILFL